MSPQLNNRYSTYAPAPALPPKGKNAGGWFRLGATLSLVVLLAAAFVNRQALTDWWRLHNYAAPVAISQLADQDTMTAQARHLFYLNHPELLNSVDTFRQRCPDSRDTIVLGCYHPVEAGIYVYNVKDPQLQGVAQVTAAHETLHAAYSRLNDKDKSNINKLLQDYYNSGQASQRVKDEIALYQKNEPDAVVDEMHSLFGTEIANLPAPLEEYYKRYFTNRGAIVAFQQQYQAEFDSRQATIARDDQQLATLKQQIDDQEDSLSQQQQSLQAQRARLDSLLAADDTVGYNAGVGSYNSQVAAYNRGISALKTTINQYNQLVVARNQVASELTTLDKAIDTRLQPQGN